MSKGQGVIKIKMCMPYYNEPHPMTKESVANVIGWAKESKEYDVKFTKYFGALISNNRHNCITTSSEIKQSLPKNTDYYLFIDNDVSFTGSDIVALIKHDKDIISGAYHRRGCSDTMVCGMWSTSPDKTVKKGIMRAETHLTSKDSGLKKVDWAGGGFLLVKKEALEKMAFPYFRHYIVSDGVQAMETSEDIGFCINAEDSGLEIYADCDVKIGHHEAVTKGDTLGRIYFDDGKMELDTNFNIVPRNMIHGVSGLITEMQSRAMGMMSYYRQPVEKEARDG